MTDAPLVLALDASHARGSVAVCRGTEPLAEILFDASDTHSATLLPAVAACLASAKTSIGAIARFAVVSGPGSFTGLRIALATVKGLAAAGAGGVAPVSSLAVLAAAFPYLDRLVLPLVDARRGEVYGALYDTRNGLPIEIAPPVAVLPAAVAALAAAGEGRPVVACGTGALRYRAEIEPSLPAGSVFASERWAIPSASLCALLALSREPLSPDELASLEPTYIRPPDARLPATALLGGAGGERG